MSEHDEQKLPKWAQKRLREARRQSAELLNEVAALRQMHEIISNRFNVATTRPKQKLIVFCSDSVLNVVPDDRRILLDSMMLKEFRRYCDDGLVQFTWQSPEYGEVILNIQWKGFD